MALHFGQMTFENSTWGDSSGLSKPRMSTHGYSGVMSAPVDGHSGVDV